jgi:hypothetical protein
VDGPAENLLETYGFVFDVNDIELNSTTQTILTFENLENTFQNHLNFSIRSAKNNDDEYTILVRNSALLLRLVFV